MRRRHILITGATGQLGPPLVDRLADEAVELTLWSRTRAEPVQGIVPLRLDIADRDALRDAFTAAQPEVIVHLAAISSIAACHADPAAAHRINADATAQLVSLCEGRGARMIYLSTDMVFDGQADRPYRETDEAHPLSVYGRSKLAGEGEVLAADGRHVVLRIAMLLGRTVLGKAKFCDQLVARLRNGEPMTLFDDEWRTPLDQRDAADAITRLAADDAIAGVFHLGGPQRVSRYEMGLRLARQMDADEALLQRASRESIDAPEPRPRDLALDSDKLLAAIPSLQRTPLDESLASLSA